MRKVIVFAFAVFAFSSLANAAGIRTMIVRYPSGSDTVSAYLAMPSSGGKHPALIVIHEWWGLTDWIRENAREFARKGYVALAIDLYRGGLTSNPQEAYKLMMSVPKERAVTDLKSAFGYLSTMDNVNSSQIGVIGWCMGGSYSFQAAVNLPKLAACVIDYGKVDASKSSVDKIGCPVLCNFAEKDKTYTPDMAKEFTSAMKANGKQVELHIYPGVDHAFMNPNNTFGYNEAQSEIAWKNIYAFLDKHLKH
ncbi:MAG: dienelactone hydrolase family protein [Bacteroidetes bacterium]|nr:dienelactone hydrolase family protein [Bacteroidota bacterium]